MFKAVVFIRIYLVFKTGFLNAVTTHKLDSTVQQFIQDFTTGNSCIRVLIMACKRKSTFSTFSYILEVH